MLEQLIYDNTISEGFFSLDKPENGLTFDETNHVMQQLMSSIDLHKLSSLFFQQLQNKLNLTALRIQFTSGSLTLGDAEKSCNIKTLDFSSQHHVFATISYSFSRVLSMREANILQELHRYFKYPLKNALEHHDLKQLAMKDHLTALGNRANYHETIRRLISQAHRQGVGFGLLVIDMDKFKQVNDNFGHQEGDKVLIAMATVLAESLRDTDFAFRFGGDEFCCLLPGNVEENNQIVAQRIQNAMSNHPCLNKHGISCSIGSANYLATDTDLSLFQRADNALYAAKEAGKNCIIAA